MENRYAPIVLFVYNRPYHTKQVLNALAINAEAIDSELWIYCDGEKTDATLEGKKNIAEVRNIVRAENRFKTVTVVEQQNNRGLANSIITGVSEIVNKKGKVIVLEDDIVPSPGFLKYMNDALALYETEEAVGCIHAWNYSLDANSTNATTFFLRGADCWGWATWKRAWQLFEPDGKKLLTELTAKKQTYSFERNGTHPFVEMLKEQISGKNNSWAIRWHASLFLKNKYCLHPVRSLVTNIGLDGSGTHSTDAYLKQRTQQKIELQKIPVEESDWFFKEYEKLYPAKNGTAMHLKNMLKKILPEKTIRTSKIIINQLRQQKNNMWSGNYKSWKEAQEKCTGYDSALILEKCKTALLKVKNGEAVYERDSVLFDEIQYSWALLAGLQKAALENDGKLCVLDFGGSLGSSFYQNKDFLSGVKNLEWCIVEQPHFVDCGKKYFEDGQLKFYHTIEACLEKHTPNVLLLASVINYLEEPYWWIEKFIQLKIPYILLDRTVCIDAGKDILTVQNVPEKIYRASYPCWLLNSSRLKNAFELKYKLLADTIDYLNLKMEYENKEATWRFLMFKLS